jgi:hypothetical protein
MIFNNSGRLAKGITIYNVENINTLLLLGFQDNKEMKHNV